MIQGKPVFNADGGYTEEMTGTMKLRGHVLNVRAAISGLWRLDETGDRLHYEVQDSMVHEVTLDGRSLAPAMFEGSFAQAMKKPHGTNIRIEDDVLWLEWDNTSLSCQRTPGEALS